jgi:hypothetical protein
MKTVSGKAMRSIRFGLLMLSCAPAVSAEALATIRIQRRVKRCGRLCRGNQQPAQCVRLRGWMDQ